MYLIIVPHKQVAAITVDLNSAKADTNGYAWVALTPPVSLPAGARLFLLSSEDDADAYFDQGTMMQSARLRGFATPVWAGLGNANFSDPGLSSFDNDPGFSSGKCFGPINMQLEQ